MADNSLILSSKSTEKKVLIIALILSILFHVLLFLLIEFDLFKYLVIPEPIVEKIEPVTFVFPENEPRQVVENMNENDEVPENSDLLSERDSRARSEKILENHSNQPYSEGNVDLMNLAKPEAMTNPQQEPNRQFQEGESFNREVLIQNEGAGAALNPSQSPYANQQHPVINRRPGTDNMFNQTDYSADMLGDISLSTYAWEWAPYLNEFKRKLYDNWRVPAGYFLFGIKGKTVMNFTIDRDGNLIQSTVVSHEGHESLQVSSELVIKKCFPFLPLPVNFPDDSLNVTFTLIYPGVEKRN